MLKASAEYICHLKATHGELYLQLFGVAKNCTVTKGTEEARKRNVNEACLHSSKETADSKTEFLELQKGRLELSRTVHSL